MKKSKVFTGIKLFFIVSVWQIIVFIPLSIMGIGCASGLNCSWVPWVYVLQYLVMFFILKRIYSKSLSVAWIIIICLLGHPGVTVSLLTSLSLIIAS